MLSPVNCKENRGSTVTKTCARTFVNSILTEAENESNEFVVHRRRQQEQEQDVEERDRNEREDGDESLQLVRTRIS